MIQILLAFCCFQYLSELCDARQELADCETQLYGVPPVELLPQWRLSVGVRDLVRLPNACIPPMEQFSAGLFSFVSTELAPESIVDSSPLFAQTQVTIPGQTCAWGNLLPRLGVYWQLDIPTRMHLLHRCSKRLDALEEFFHTFRTEKLNHAFRPTLEKLHVDLDSQQIHFLAQALTPYVHIEHGSHLKRRSSFWQPN